MKNLIRNILVVLVLVVPVFSYAQVAAVMQPFPAVVPAEPAPLGSLPGAPPIVEPYATKKALEETQKSVNAGNSKLRSVQDAVAVTQQKVEANREADQNEHRILDNNIRYTSANVDDLRKEVEKRLDGFELWGLIFGIGLALFAFFCAWRSRAGINGGFDRIRREIRSEGDSTRSAITDARTAINTRIDGLTASVDGAIGAVNSGFESVNTNLTSLNQGAAALRETVLRMEESQRNLADSVMREVNTTGNRFVQQQREIGDELMGPIEIDEIMKGAHGQYYRVVYTVMPKNGKYQTLYPRVPGTAAVCPGDLLEYPNKDSARRVILTAIKENLEDAYDANPVSQAQRASVENMKFHGLNIKPVPTSTVEPVV